ncbi:MAG: zinc dependent phospholipase C family protein [Candidatus Thorarchaeota archaeon]
MRRASAVLILLVLPIFTAVVFTPMVTTVDAWGHPTHFFIVEEAMGAISNQSWSDAFDYYHPEIIGGSIYPDTAWQDWDNHLYYPHNGTHSAPTAVQRWYNFTRNNFTIGNWADGFFAAGIMAHYFSDVNIPIHTDVWWEGHSAYETDINNNLNLFTITPPTEAYIANASALTVSSATFSHQYYNAVYLAYPTGSSVALETNTTIQSLTEACLNLAIDNLLDLFYTATLGINAPNVTITYQYKAMIDFAHGNDYAPTNLNSINTTLSREGFELIVQNSVITTESLAGVDLFIATCASTAYTAAEITAIANWASSGSKALLLTGRGDHPSSSTNTAYPEDILESIGSNIRMNDDNVYQLMTYQLWYNDLTEIPIAAETVNLTAFVDKVTFFSPSSLYFVDDGPVLPIIYANVTAYQTNQAAPAITVIYDDVSDGMWGDQIPLAAAEEIGSTRVFVTGTTFFSDYDYGKPQFDNIQLFENYLDWAVGNRSEWNIADVDEVGPRIMDVSWDPPSPEDGETVTVSVNVTDPSGVNVVWLNYNNGTHDISLQMTPSGGDIYTGVISDVTSGSLSFVIEAHDNSGNIAYRVSFTIDWTPPVITTTTTTTTTTSTSTTTPTETTSTSPTEPSTTPPPPLPQNLMLILGIGGAVVILLIVVIFVKKR